MKPILYKGLRVPWIAIWEGEKVPSRMEFRDGLILPAKGGSHNCRFEHGMWMLAAPKKRTGEPDFGATHSARQRQAMKHLLCQVCGERKPDVSYWVIPDSEPHHSLWDDGMVLNAPVCGACLRYAEGHCPFLQTTGPYAVEPIDEKLRPAVPVAVTGDLFMPAMNGWRENVMAPLDHEMRKLMVGRELVVKVER